MVDRQVFPRDKVCGDGMPVEIMKLLREMNVDIQPHKLQYHRIRSLSISSPSGRALQTFEAQRDVFSMTSPRYSFDHALYHHALKAGAKFEQMNVVKPLMNADGQQVRGIIERRNNRLIEYEARLVIAAGGVASPIARALRGESSQSDVTAIAIRAYACLKQPVEACVYFYFQKNLLPGYAWLFPVGEDRVNVGIYLHQSQGQKLRVLLDEFCAQVGVEMEIDPATVKTWSLPLYVSNESRAMPGVLMVGDEGRFVNALTGGGIYSAMLTGHEAAIQAVKLLEDHPSDYDRAWRAQLAGGLQRGHFVQKNIASHPALFNALFAFSAHPLLRHRFLKAIAGDHY
jgi:geranylgeranyl reductase family protein